MALAQAVVVSLLVWRPTLELDLETDDLVRQPPFQFAAALDFPLPHGYRLVGDSMAHPDRSSLQLIRDGSPIGAPHSVHDEVRNVGNGAYSHWDTVLYFSTPGNTDPTSDGHRYGTRATLELSTLFGTLLLSTCALLAAALLPGALRAVRSARGERLLSWLRDQARARRVTRIARPVAAILVFVCVAASFSRDWNEYFVQSDSYSYISGETRPPVVALWIDLFSDRQRVGERLDALAREPSDVHAHRAAPDDPIIAPIQAQRILMAASIAVLTLALTHCMPVASALAIAWIVAASSLRPDAALDTLMYVTLVLLAIQFLAPPLWNAGAGPGAVRSTALSGPVSTALQLAAVVISARSFNEPLTTYSFLSEQQNFLLSEPLALSWQLLFAACMVRFIWTRRGSFLLGAAVFAGLGYATRSASVFLFAILGCLMLLALWSDRRRLKGFVVGAAAIAGIGASLGPIVSAVRGGEIVSSAPMLNWGPIAFALKVAQPGDERLLSDETGRHFLRTALAQREGLLDASPPPRFQSEDLGTYLYLLAMPVAEQVAPHAGNAELSALLADVSRPILIEHVREYLAIVGESFRVATGLYEEARTTRLFATGFDWLAVILLVVLAFAGPYRNVRVGLAAGLLAGMHVSHMAVVSVFDLPTLRYVYATEIFVVLALGVSLDHHIRSVLGSFRRGFRAIVRRGNSGWAPRGDASPTESR